MDERLKALKTLLSELADVTPPTAKAAFTQHFKQGCELLDYEDDDAAVAFDTSRPNASRWRRGKAVPPAASLVLKLLRQLVEQKISKLERIKDAGGYSGGYAVAAKSKR